jgi:putative flippase GtrA
MPLVVKQFMRFFITGSINAAIDFIVYLGLTRSFHFWQQHLVWATGVAFVVANTNSYFMNRYWTFQSRTQSKKMEYGKFLTVSLIGLGINVVTFHYLVYWFSLHDVFAKVVVAGIVLVWNFSANKFWTFKHAL